MIGRRKTGFASVALALSCMVMPLATRPLSAQTPILEDVLARASEYAAAYQNALAGIVSEEAYEQTWRRGTRTQDTRALRSDVLLTRPDGGKRYLLFRDVFEVDGRQVRDRDQRLEQLFLKPSESTSRQAVRIMEESARYNIGDITRTVNTPTLALVLLDPQFRNRFKYGRSEDTMAESVRGLPASDEQARFVGPEGLFVISYQELGPETLIVTGEGFGLPASGRFWIEPATGRVVMTELQLRNQAIDALVDVRYEESDAVGLMVPLAMRERYRDIRKNSIVEGLAQYSRVRRFQVSSSEEIAESKR